MGVLAAESRRSPGCGSARVLSRLGGRRHHACRPWPAVVAVASDQVPPSFSRKLSAKVAGFVPRAGGPRKGKDVDSALAWVEPENRPLGKMTVGGTQQLLYL